MTRKTTARVAGTAFLFYIAVGITSLVVGSDTASGETATARLASIAQHAQRMRFEVFLTLLMVLSAIVLAVTLYSLTRDEDREIALLGMAFRIAEGVQGGAGALVALGVVRAAAASGPETDPAVAAAVDLALKSMGSNPLIAATFFAIGSTCFSFLLLRGRMIPAWLAWLGLGASLLLVLGLPLTLLEFLSGWPASAIWAPMAAFEIVLAIWLIVKGAEPARAPAAV